MAYQVVKKRRFLKSHIKLLIYLEDNWGYKVAYSFQLKIDTNFKLLEEQPYLGKPTTKENARSISITPHNRVMYKIVGEKIIIIAMYDTRMNPKKNRYL